MKVAFINVNDKAHGNASLELSFFLNKCSLELGTRYLHANTNWHPEDEVLHFNLLKERLNGKCWKEGLLRFTPDVVALSFLSFYAEEASELAKWIKHHLTSVVIAGGPHVTSVGPSVLNDTNLDYACVGEGEVTFRVFINTLRMILAKADGSAVRQEGAERICAALVTSIPGLVYRQSGRVLYNACAAVKNLDMLRFPTSVEVNPLEYSEFSSQLNLKLPYVPIMTTRGCPYKCIYCHSIMGKHVRTRSAAHVISEVDYWYREKGISIFYISDDIFNVDKDRLKHIFREFARHRKYRFAFPNGLRADLLDNETIDMLVEGGTFFAVLAIESASPRIQKVIKKRLDLDATLKAINHFGSSGVTLGAFNILGFPGETETDIRATIQFNAEAVGLKKATFFLLCPHPGTEAFELAVRDGWQPTNAPSAGYFGVPQSSTTRHVSPTQLVQLRREAYQAFYLRAERIRKCIDERNPNLDDNTRIELHRVDYSYVMRQILGLNLFSEALDSQVFGELNRLCPSGLLTHY